MFKGVSWNIEKCFKGVSSVFQWNSKDVSSKFHKMEFWEFSSVCVGGGGRGVDSSVSRKFQGYLKKEGAFATQISVMANLMASRQKLFKGIINLQEHFASFKQNKKIMEVE